VAIRPYRETDAPRCCEIILACLPQLDGLNDGARTFLVQKLVPERLHSELLAADALVFEEQGNFSHIEELARARGLRELRGEAAEQSSAG
jgi:hypothetical protein